MKYVNGYQCTLCGTTYHKNQNLMTCPNCGEKGILEILYDYHKMKEEVNLSYFKNCQIDNILRYAPLMSINQTDKETLSVGNTPLYKSDNLGKQLGLKYLYIKDEGVNPTASLKDRASLVACLKAIEEGKEIIACSSTGNAASSLAGNAAKLGLKSLIFVPKRAPQGKLSQLVMYGANLIKIDGDYKDTFNASKDVIDKFNLYNRNAAINPHLVEGKKTVAYEIVEQLAFTDIHNVIVSVGDGCTIAGVYKGFYDLYQLDIIDYIPRIIGVQSEGCSPFYQAWINNDELKETEENTIADSIAVGIPRNPVKAMRAVKESNGLFITVTDEEILNASVVLAKEEGIFAEPAASASIAGLIKLVEDNIIDIDDTTVVISTGNGLKDQESISSKTSGSFEITRDNLNVKIIDKLQGKEIEKLFKIIENNEVNKHE